MVSTEGLKADIVVIGAGTAGLRAFKRIVEAGKSVLLVDHGPLGTMCARVGCMPSKAALHAGRRWADAVALSPALKGSDPSTRLALFHQARKTSHESGDATEQETRDKAGDRLLMGTARFTGHNTLDVAGRRVEAGAFVVATGSHPVVPKPIAALGHRILTTDTLFELDELPRRIGVIGVGAIGLEMGLALCRLGVEVTAAGKDKLPGGIKDPKIAERAMATLGREMPMWLGQEVQAQASGDGVLMCQTGREVVVDRLLVAMGREPDIDDLDLREAGVVFDDDGPAAPDPRTLRCGDSLVFMAGDVSPDRPLQHEAVDEGLAAANHAIALVDGQEAEAPVFKRRTALSIVFTDPDIASIGMGFDKLDAGTTVIGEAEGRDNGRSGIIDARDNLLRVYADKASGRLLGASLVCVQGEHLAHLLAWAIQRGETVKSLLDMPFYHPTVEELVQMALNGAAMQIAQAQ